MAQNLHSEFMPVGRILIQSHRDMKQYRTGDTVPETGIYTVIHTAHRLAPEAVLHKDEKFPRCAKCSREVLFELSRPAAGVSPRLQYRIFELSELEDEAATA
jgi:hypothetical protein